MKDSEKINELKSKSESELLEILKKEYINLRKLRFKAKMRELKKVQEIKQSKRKIARILTILREKLESALNKEQKNEKNASR